MDFITSNATGSRYYFYFYNNNRFRVVFQKNCRLSGFEEINKTNNTTDSSEVERISLSRTKRNIKEICLCNNFTHFATLTINSVFCDRFHLQSCQDKLKYIIRERIRRKNKDFAYIFITEKHKNGAFHFHGLVKNLNDLYINNNGYLSHKAFDEIGFNSFLEIDTSGLNSYEKVCNYITKYITKACIKNENNHIYISSRGLKKAERYEIHPLSFNNWNYENEYCKIKDYDFTKDTISLNDYNILTNIIEKNKGYFKFL